MDEPTLRFEDHRTDAAPDTARQRVVAENQAAADAGIDATDPRWILAARVQSQLEGATLPPEGRARVMKAAAHLGLRPFDANVIIALVQDRARRGETVQGAAEVLKMVPEVVRRDEDAGLGWARWGIALAAGLVGAWVLVRWVVM